MRTKTFNLAITTALAASLSACGQPSGDWDDGVTQYADRDTAVCVDRVTQKRIPDRECDRRGVGGNTNPALWYYLGRNSAVPYYGDTIRGGSYSRPAGRSFYHAPASTAMTKSSAVSRGGFGSSARSSGFHSSSS